MAAVQIVAQFSPGLFQNGTLLGLAEVFRSPDTAVVAEKALVIGCLSDLYAQAFTARADKFDGGDTLTVRRSELERLMVERPAGALGSNV